MWRWRGETWRWLLQARGHKLRPSSSQHNWKEWGKDSLLETLQETWPCRYLHLSSGKLLLDVWSPELWENFYWFKPPSLWCFVTGPQETGTNPIVHIISHECGVCLLGLFSPSGGTASGCTRSGSADPGGSWTLSTVSVVEGPKLVASQLSGR